MRGKQSEYVSKLSIRQKVKMFYRIILTEKYRELISSEEKRLLHIKQFVFLNGESSGSVTIPPNTHIQCNNLNSKPSNKILKNV